MQKSMIKYDTRDAIYVNFNKLINFRVKSEHCLSLVL